MTGHIRRNTQPVNLYWGMRTEADLYLHDEIQRWAEHLYEFQYIPVLSRASGGWTGPPASE